MTGDFETTLAADVLPAPVARVLLSAHEVIRARRALKLDDVLTTRSTHKILEVIDGYPPLRAHLRSTLSTDPDDPDGDLARQLVDAEQARADDAVHRVRELLDLAKSEARNARRSARKAERPTAAEKASTRDQRLVLKLRQQRDQARNQAASADEERIRQLDINADLRAELDTVRTRLAASEHMLAAVRESLTDLPTAARHLADALAARQDQPRTVVQTPRDAESPEPAAFVALRAAATSALSDDLDAGAVATVTEWLPRLLRSMATPPRLEAFTELDLTVDVLGGGDEVGGSCILISAAGTRILVDCGTRPSGVDEESLAPPGIKRALAGPIDAIVVTHAHNDHGGWIPAVIAAQPRTRVIATEATCDLLATMWDDSAKVLNDQVGTHRWKGGPLPPYSRADVHVALDRLEVLDYQRVLPVGQLTVELFRAGHIIGAAGVVVTAGEHRVVVTGDVSAGGQATVGGFETIPSARAADLVLLESTYAGQRGADPRAQVVKDFVRSVTATLDLGGVALVPSFALGRAQEVALICAEYLPGAEVLVDGLARDVCQTYERYDGPNGRRLRIFGGNVRPVERGKTIDEKIRLKSGVVIATSGMLSSGPALTWAKRVLPDPSSALLLVGYQDPQSPGGRLMGLSGGGRFSLPNRDAPPDEVDVLAKVDSFHLGAHANEDDLVRIADGLRPELLMLVHGDGSKQQLLAGTMMQRGHRTTLATGTWRPGGIIAPRTAAN